MPKLLVLLKNIFNFFLCGIFVGVLIALDDTSLATISTPLPFGWRYKHCPSGNV